MAASNRLTISALGACALLACSSGSDDGSAGANGGSAASGGSNPFGNSTQGNAASGGSGGAGGMGSVVGVLPDGGLACADTLVRTSRVTPTVILLVDQSSSMEEDFGDGSRWNVLRDFLLQDPEGLIADLQQQVRFGLALYSAEEDAAECPLVTTVEPAIDNYDAIAATYREAEPIGDTPTGDSIRRAGSLRRAEPAERTRRGDRCGAARVRARHSHLHHQRGQRGLGAAPAGHGERGARAAGW
jgi:hypothetical protein